MEYYNNTLKDDFHLIVESGWKPKLIYGQDKKGNIKKNEFEADLLPKNIVIKEFFKNEADKLENENNELNFLIQEFESKVEENTGDESIFSDDEKVNETLIKDKIKEETEKNIVVLKELLSNLSNQKNKKKVIKELQETLNEKVISKYSVLTESESKQLIVYSKWFDTLTKKFNSHMNSLVNNLSQSIIKLEEEYQLTLGDLNNEIKSKENELSMLLRELYGDNDDIKAFDEFIKQLGGAM